MGIISKLKSVLGVADDGQERAPDRGRTVTPEAEPETTSERAVKGVDEPTGAEPTSGGVDESEPEAANDVEAAGTEPEEVATDPDEPAAGRGEPVESIKGIGGAYAQRLADAGVDDVADLARADPEEIAAATDLGTGRVGKWIERARARTE